MLEIFKKNYKFILGIVVGGLIVGSTVYALTGTDIVYDNSNSNLTSTTVQGAIDEVYAISKEKLSKVSVCDYVCPNERYIATYANGEMVACKYKYTGAVSILAACNGGFKGEEYSLYMCKLSRSMSENPRDYCSTAFESGHIAGGGCPTTYTCP